MLCVGGWQDCWARIQSWNLNNPAAVQGQRTAHVPIKPSDYNWYHVSRWLDSKARGQQIRQREDLRCWPSTVWPVTLCHFHPPLSSPSRHPSLPSLPTPCAINHLAHSLGRCQALKTPTGSERKRSDGLRGEKRDRDGTERRRHHLRACSLILKCNTPISMLISSVTVEMDVCDFLAGVAHT